jgi:hypothetical protein
MYLIIFSVSHLKGKTENPGCRSYSNGWGTDNMYSVHMKIQLPKCFWTPKFSVNMTYFLCTNYYRTQQKVILKPVGWLSYEGPEGRPADHILVLLMWEKWAHPIQMVSNYSVLLEGVWSMTAFIGAPFHGSVSFLLWEKQKSNKMTFIAT